MTFFTESINRSSQKFPKIFPLQENLGLIVQFLKNSLSRNTQ